MSPTIFTPAERPSLKNEISTTLRLAGPLAAGFAGNQMLGLVDTIVAGRIGAVEIAAVGIGGALFLAGAIFFMGVLMGLDPLAAQAIGAGKPWIARTRFQEALRLALLLSVPAGLLIAGLGMAAPWAVNTDVATSTGVMAYLSGRGPSVILLLLQIAMQSYLQANGRTRPVMVGTIVANVINLPGSFLLAHGDAALVSIGLPAIGLGAGLGVFGIGLASSIVVGVQVLVLWRAIRRLPKHEAPEGELAMPTRAGARKIIGMGWPIGVHFQSEMGVFATVTVLMGGMGPIAAGGHQVALQLASFTFTVCLGLSNATAVRVGYAVGRRDPVGTRRAGLVGIGVGLVFMGSTAVGFALFAEPLARMVAPEAEIVAMAVGFLHIAAVFQIFDGMQAIGAGALRGAGDTRVSMRLTFFGHWCVGMPVGVLLTYGFEIGPEGLWWGLVAGLATTGTSLVVHFLRTGGDIAAAT